MKGLSGKENWMRFMIHGVKDKKGANIKSELLSELL